MQRALRTAPEEPPPSGGAPRDPTVSGTSPGPRPPRKKGGGNSGAAGALSRQHARGRRASFWIQARQGCWKEPPPRSLVGPAQGLWVPTVRGEGPLSLAAHWAGAPPLLIPARALPPRQVGEGTAAAGTTRRPAPSPDAGRSPCRWTENRWFKQTRSRPLLSAGEKAGSAHTLDTCLQGTYSWGGSAPGQDVKHPFDSRLYTDIQVTQAHRRATG